MSSPILLSLQNISKQYGHFSAVKDASIQVAKGDIVALLGQSGSGKTTLLRLMAGLEKPDSGNVERKGKTTMVFQSLALWPHTTVRTHLELVLNGPRWTKSLRNQRVEEMMQTFGITSWAERKPGMLSGGQQQRVALARALAPDPDILLLDEPLTHLDTDSRTDLRSILKPMLANRAVVLATHEQEDAQTFATIFYQMKSGNLSIQK